MYTGSNFKVIRSHTYSCRHERSFTLIKKIKTFFVISIIRFICRQKKTYLEYLYLSEDFMQHVPVNIHYTEASSFQYAYFIEWSLSKQMIDGYFSNEYLKLNVKKSLYRLPALYDSLKSWLNNIKIIHAKFISCEYAQYKCW